MAKERKTEEKIELEVSVNLKEYEEEEVKLAAYVYNHAGRLVAKELIKVNDGRGVAEFEIEAAPQRLLVKVGPDFKDMKELPRSKPLSRKVEVIPGKKAELDLEILKPGWICWFKVPYLVTGTVKKEYQPICSGEVDIYEVDFGPCIWKLPDLVIERVRDALIDVIIDPPPIEIPEILVWPDRDDDDWCGTGPKPPIPHRRLLSDEQITDKLEKLPVAVKVCKAAVR